MSEMGPVELELTEESTTNTPYSVYSAHATTRTKRCVHDAAVSLGFCDAGEAWFRDCLPDVFSEAIEAAHELGL